MPRALPGRQPGRGGCRTALTFHRDPVGTLVSRCSRYGDLFGLTTLVAGRMLVVGSPQLARWILTAPQSVLHAGTANRRMLPVLPAGTLLTSDGVAHHDRRRELAPMFRAAALNRLAPEVGRLAAEETRRWPAGEPFALLPATRFLTLRIIARLLVGMTDRTAVRELAAGLHTALHPYTLLAGHGRLGSLGRVSPQAAAGRRHRRFAGVLDRLAERGMLDPAALDRLGTAETFALLLAGYETTATALTWTALQLARAPDVTAALRREDESSDRPLLDAVIWESLRLWPPLVDIVRQVADPMVLAGRHLDPGTILLIPPPLIHRRAAAAEQDRFDPPALAQQRMAEQPRARAAWLPFGGGPRRCLGAPLATLELRIVLTHLIHTFRLRLPGSALERTRLYGTALVPAHGGQIVLERRDRRR